MFFEDKERIRAKLTNDAMTNMPRDVEDDTILNRGTAPLSCPQKVVNHPRHDHAPLALRGCAVGFNTCQHAAAPVL
jgi:hypothetical protein